MRWQFSGRVKSPKSAIVRRPIALTCSAISSKLLLSPNLLGASSFSSWTTTSAPRFRQPQGNRLPDAPPRTRDDGDFARQMLTRHLPSLPLPDASQH
jgi:hypothetical protein